SGSDGWVGTALVLSSFGHPPPRRRARRGRRDTHLVVAYGRSMGLITGPPRGRGGGPGLHHSSRAWASGTGTTVARPPAFSRSRRGCAAASQGMFSVTTRGTWRSICRTAWAVWPVARRRTVTRAVRVPGGAASSTTEQGGTAGGAAWLGAASRPE